MPNTGLNSYIGVEAEASYGVDPAGTPEWIRIVSENLRFAGAVSRGNRGLGLMTPKGVRAINRKTSGDVVIDPLYRGNELLLLDFFGAVATAGAGPYTHTFTPSLTRQVGLTQRMQQDALLSIISGLKTNRLDFEITNENLQMTFGFTGQVGAQNPGTTSPTFQTAPPVLAVEATNGLTYKIDSVEECIESASVNCALPHSDDKACLGNTSIKEPTINDYLTIEGELVRDMDNDDYEDKFQAFSTHVLEFNYMSEDDIAAHPGNKWEMRIKLFAAQFLEAKAPTEGPGAIIETIPFRAEADGSGNIMEVVLVSDRVTVP